MILNKARASSGFFFSCLTNLGQTLWRTHMYTLLHGSLEPLIYGLVIFIGIALIWWKIISGRLLSAAIDISVFYLVFSLHGGTLAGGMAAAVAALLAGITFPFFMRGAK